MKCSKCRSKNINIAKFCKSCGNAFTDKERETAKKGTFVWYLEKIDDIKSIVDLSFITGKLWFKISSIIFVLGIGIYFYMANGSEMKLLKSDQYKVEYNAKLDEYYLLVTKEKTNLELYFPENVKDIKVKNYDKENKILKEKKYKKDAEIILENTDDESYYILEGVYNGHSDKMKLYIYRTEVQ